MYGRKTLIAIIVFSLLLAPFSTASASMNPSGRQEAGEPAFDPSTADQSGDFSTVDEIPSFTVENQTQSFILYVSPSGSDSNNGTSVLTPVRTLLAACKRVDFRRGVRHIIYVRGGTYTGQSMLWSHLRDDEGKSNACYNLNSLSPVHALIIAAYKAEKPVFEGQGYPVLIDFRKQSGQCTNITIVGLTIRHYANFAIRLYGNRNSNAGWNGCNTISSNVFEEIGSKFDTSHCPECVGYAAIDLVNSDRNIIRNNVMVNIENKGGDGGLMHAVYFAHNSSQNIVSSNYISMVSGDTMRVRDGSNENQIFSNYVDRSGVNGFISGWHDTNNDEKTSYGNVISSNIVTFPYPSDSSIALICKCDNSFFVDKGGGFFEGNRPLFESVGGIVSGDFNGDKKTELVVAFHYPGMVKVVSTTGGSDRYLRKVLYLSRYYEVLDFATGDFDQSGKDQILTYFRLKSNGRTEVYRGNGATSLTNLGRVYLSDIWKITAMTAGDFNGDGQSEAVTAFKNGQGETRVYRGDGTKELGNLGRFYASTVWSIPAMTSGDFDQDGKDELFSAFQSSTETRIYRGNAINSATNIGLVYKSTIWDIPAMTTGTYVGDDKPRLVTAFKHSDSSEVRIYNGDGITSATSLRIYQSEIWRISGLASGQFNLTPSDELATAFTWSSRNQIWSSNGRTGATNGSVFHRWSAP